MLPNRVQYLPYHLVTLQECWEPSGTNWVKVLKRATPGFEPSETHFCEKTQVKLEILKFNISCHMDRIDLKIDLTPFLDVGNPLVFLQ